MRRSVFVVASVATALGLVATPASADQKRKEFWATIGMDTAVMGYGQNGRADMTYWFLMTSRAHFGLGRNVSLSMGISHPLLQLMFALAAKGSGAGAIALFGVGLNLPLEVRFSPESRDVNGVVFTVGATPLVDTTVMCAFAGSCGNRTKIDVGIGYAGELGMGYQWADGSFVTLAYASGHVFSGGNALEGLYKGAWLSFGASFGR